MCTRLPTVAGILLLAGLLATTGQPAAPPAARGPRFTAPPGFIVETDPGPPLVRVPLVACFDERGRLFVAHSAGRNVNFREEPNARPNSIRLLEDTRGVGRFDQFTVFADKMTFPTGAPWHDLPRRYPPYQTCHRRFQQWQRTGLLTQLLQKLAEDLRDRGKLDLSESFIDASFSSAKKGALLSALLAGAKAAKSWRSATAPMTVTRWTRRFASASFNCASDRR